MYRSRHGNKWDLADLERRNYRPGSILRIHMVNFLTYDDCQVFPGPRLNVVLGPNGTGKSTMTHAICLACGGSPAAIGRAPELNKFVKNDKQGEECFIEVDILSTNKSVYTIRRDINALNKQSHWYLNGEKSKEATIKELMNRMSIDMMNLCSFMPQDRVGKFTRLSPKEVLSETLKCISSSIPNKTLYDIQQELSDVEENKLKNEEEKMRKQTTIEMIETQLAALRGDVEKMTQRKEAIRNLEIAQVAEKLYRLEDFQKNRDTKQFELDELNTVLAQENERIRPLELKEREYKRHQALIERSVETARSEYRKIESSLSTLKTKSTSFDDEIEQLSIDLDGMTRERAEHESRLQICINEKAKMEIDYQNALHHIPNVESKLTEISRELIALGDEERQLDEKKCDLHGNVRQHRGSEKEILKELQQLQDYSQLFRSRLAMRVDNLSKQALKAMDWIDKPENRSQFKGEIYGPIGRHLKIADAACGIMVERIIPARKLMLAYVFTDESDANKFKLVTDNLSISVDIFTLSNRRFPVRQYSNEFINNMSQLPLQVLVDSIQCPDDVMSYLYMEFSLQNILWCRIDTSQTIITNKDYEVLCGQSSFKLFIDNVQSSKAANSSQRLSKIDIQFISGSRSRYHSARALATSVEPSVTPKNILVSMNTEYTDDMNADDKRLQLRQHLDNTRQRIEAEELQLKRITDDIDTIHAKISTLRENKTKLQKVLKLPSDLKMKIDLHIRRIRDLEKIVAVPINNAKKEKLNLYKTKVLNYQQLLQEISNLCLVYLKVYLDYSLTEDSKQLLKDQLHQALREIEDARKSLSDLKRSISLKKDDINRIDLSMKRVQDELEAIEKEHGEDEFKNIMGKIAEYPQDQQTLPAVQDLIATLNDKIQRYIDNQGAVNRFDDLTKQLAIAKEEFNEIVNKFNTLDRSLKTRLDEWLDGVENVRRKLHVQFEEYMRELKYDGGVDLIKVGKITDYELQMKVSFRDNCDLTNLSGSRHSGGERNVSTMMFLMALQDMTNSPFRIVDEINQGMDERNERLVCDRIVRNCCSSKRSPQYFLISPKLLEALSALNNDNITVLVVFNGPGAHLDWDIPGYIKLLKSKHSDIFDSEDDTDEEEQESSTFKVIKQESISTSSKPKSKVQPALDCDDQDDDERDADDDDGTEVTSILKRVNTSMNQNGLFNQTTKKFRHK